MVTLKTPFEYQNPKRILSPHKRSLWQSLLSGKIFISSLRVALKERFVPWKSSSIRNSVNVKKYLPPHKWSRRDGVLSHAKLPPYGTPKWDEIFIPSYRVAPGGCFVPCKTAAMQNVRSNQSGMTDAYVGICQGANHWIATRYVWITEQGYSRSAANGVTALYFG